MIALLMPYYLILPAPARLRRRADGALFSRYVAEPRYASAYAMLACRHADIRR